jgi:hypothetical protein
MPVPGARHAIGLCAALLSLAGCASVSRPQLSPEAVSALSSTAPDIRREASNLQQIAADTSNDPYEVLALSGGGPDGTFGVGFLTGLQETGRLPRFTVITGVSTGALIAPFLFADPQGLAKLKDFYTAPDVARLTSKRSLIRVLRRPGFISNAPLKQSIESAVDMALLSATAQEHARGRRLLIATVNLDSQRLVLWDMGAIATPGTPEALQLFRQVLLAAVSVPVAMDPVMMAVGSPNQAMGESHVDAGVVSPFHLAPELLPASGCGRVRKCRVTVIIHNKLVAEPRVVPLRIGAVTTRTLETVVKSQLAVRIREAQAFSAARGAEFRMSFIDVPFPGVSALDFDPDYMGRLFEIGLRRGSSAEPWSVLP